MTAAAPGGPPPHPAGGRRQPTTPWPGGADGLLCEILLGFQRITRLAFRQDVLETMGRHAGPSRIDADIDELPDARSHVRAIVYGVGCHRDRAAALDALCGALAEHAPYDGALPWLELTALALTGECGLPADVLLSVIRHLLALTPQPDPEHLRHHLPLGVSGLALLAPGAGLPEIMRRLLDRRDADPGPVLHFLHGLATEPALAAHPGLPALRVLLTPYGRPRSAPAPFGAPAGGPFGGPPGSVPGGVPGPASGPAGIPYGSASGPAAPPSRLIVQIRLDPETPEHIDNTRYLLRASFYRQPLTGGRFDRIDTLGATRSLAKEDLVEHGSARLAEWPALAGAMRAADGRHVRIEFLLPAGLLGHSAELWSPSRSGHRLGHHYPVVVRSLERYADPWLNPGPWRERWNHLFADTLEPDVLDGIGWPPLVPERAADLPGWLAARPALACMGLETPYEQLDSRVRSAVREAIEIDGVPAVLWRRGSGDPAELVEALRACGADSLARLPETVHLHRKVNRAADGQDGITLLWDDPDCVDPDQDAPYPGMV